MKKTVIGMAAALGMMMLTGSCGGNDKTDTPQAPAVTAAPAAPLPEGAVPSYRFINMDTIFMKYNLSIDYNEQMLRLTNDYEAEYKRKMTTLSSKGKSLEQQYDNIQQQRVQLPSEVEAFQKDVQNFQSQTNKTQQELMDKQLQIEKQQAMNLQTVMDSLQNFLREYAPAKGYTAIFYSTQTAGYYHPSLDVTNEVVEGLNARYNKVNK